MDVHKLSRSSCRPGAPVLGSRAVPFWNGRIVARAGALGILAASMTVIGAAAPAQANCNAIPGVPSSFRASVGSVDKPFASPGDFVAVTDFTAPTVAARSVLASSEVVVTVVFTPPNDGPRNAVVLTAAPSCDELSGLLAACRLQLGGRDPICVHAPQSGLVVEPPATTGETEKVHFRFPDTSVPMGGGVTLAGPAAIAVTSTGADLPCALSLTNRCMDHPGLVACVDELFAADNSSPPNPGEVFNHFTALPPPNDYQALCREERLTVDGVCAEGDPPPSCQGAQEPLYLAVDAAGNALVPIDWSGVVEGASCSVPPTDGSERVVPTTARFVHAMFGLEAFKGGVDDRVRIPSNAFLRSFTADGRALAPIFDAQVGAEGPPTPIFGFADGCRSVLRVARRGRGFHECSGASPPKPCTEPARCFEGICDAECDPGDTCVPATCAGDGRPCASDADCRTGDECGPSLFELRDRLIEGVGPIAIPPKQREPSAAPFHQLLVGDNAPLDGIQETRDLIAFSVPEAMNGRDLNGDDDQSDEVLQIVARRGGSGRPTNTCRAVARTEDAGFSYPAFATEGDTVALLDPEGAANADANLDADVLDVILRVFKLDTLVTPDKDEHLRAATLAPLANTRSLALSDGLVFLRNENTNYVISAASTHNFFWGKGASFQPALAPWLDDDHFMLVFTSVANFPGIDDNNNPYEDIYFARHHGFFGPTPFVSTHLLIAGGIDGLPVAGPSMTPTISRNAIVAFASDAPNLAASDDGGFTDIFVADNRSGQDELEEVELVSANDAGLPGHGRSFPYPAISANEGRYVVFWSAADDLVADDTNGLADVFVRDRCPVDESAGGCTPVTEMISADTPSTGDWERRRPSISADGRFVTFVSGAVGLVEGDDNGAADVFVHDRCVGGPAGCQRRTELVSVGNLEQLGNGDSYSASISANGRFVAFVSEASNLVAGDENDVADIFVRDRCTGDPACLPNTERVSISSFGAEADGPSYDQPAISADGQVVAFTSAATNLVLDDANVCESVTHSAKPGSCPDVFAHNRSTRLTERVSTAPNGPESDDASGSPSISPNGQQIAFVSAATNFIPLGYPFLRPDSNGAADVFVRVARKADPYGNRLGVFDTATNDFAAPVDSLCSATNVTVAGRHVAFLRWEDGDPDCPSEHSNSMNGDFDHHDRVVNVWSPGSNVRNYRCAATALALSTEWLAALVDEAAEGNTDLNRDGDTDDRVVKAYDLDGHPPRNCNGWLEVRGADGRQQAAEVVAVSGSIVAFLTPECAQHGSVTSRDCPLGGTDLNGDGDADDRVIQLFDARRRVLHNVGQPAKEFVLGTRFVAFRTHEADLCRSSVPADPKTCACDLNGDDDCCDDVLRAYDFGDGVEHGCLLNTAQAAVPCRSAACDPRVPYRVGDGTISFLRPRTGGGASCDGDDGAAVLLQTYNERVGYSQQCSASPPPGASPADRVAARADATRARQLESGREVGPVFQGLCTNAETACADDADCPPPGACVLPPGGCVVDLEVPCTPGVPRPGSEPTCGADELCALRPDRSGGFSCQLVQRNEDESLRSCRRDADCGAGALCTDGVQSMARLVSPLSGATTGGPVFVSAGQCVEQPSGRVHGSCTTDGDCPPTSDASIRCERGLIAASAADTDGDEVPDPFDNCPTVRNILQEDHDENGVGDACQALGCPAAPRELCVSADSGKARLSLELARRNALVWKWKRGEATLQTFGDPAQTDPYALCLYEVGEETRAPLRLGLAVSPGVRCDTRRCWKRKGTDRFSYRDARDGSIGISRMELRTKASSGAEILVRARGAGLIGRALPLGATLEGPSISVKAQLVNLNTGSCWEASYGRAKRNDEKIFNATND